MQTIYCIIHKEAYFLTKYKNKIRPLFWHKNLFLNFSPCEVIGAGGLNGGGGENGGEPGQGFVVPDPHNRGLLAKLQFCTYDEY